MKKILIVILFTLISFAAFSQKGGNYNYSIGVRGYNYMQMPKVFNQNAETYLTSYFNSYIVKFNDNLWSYRLNGSHFDRSVLLTNVCDNCETLDGQMKDFSFKMGFEKNFNYSVVQPYFALDLGYRSNKFEGKAIGGEFDSYHAKSNKGGFTVTPAFGIKINPIDQLSLFAESNVEWFYGSTTQERYNNNESDIRSSQKFKKGEFLLNPFTIGVQFHLDSTD